MLTKDNVVVDEIGLKIDNKDFFDSEAININGYAYLHAKKQVN